MTDLNRDFNCNEGGALLGHPGATAGPCDEVLPGVWRVVLKSPDIVPGGATVRTFIWDGGVATHGGGVKALAATLKRIGAHERASFDTFAVQVLLEATGGGPPGFSPHTVSGDVGGQRAEVRTRPFGLTLVTQGWRAPAAPFAAIPGGPDSPPTDRGPLGPAPGTPDMAPDDDGPPGGVAPMNVALADLALDSDYRGAWTISVANVPGSPFEVVMTVPVSP